MISSRTKRYLIPCLRRQAVEWRGVMSVGGTSMTFDYKSTEIFVAWGPPGKVGIGHIYATFKKSPFPDFSFSIISDKGSGVVETLVRVCGHGIEVLQGFWARSDNEPLLRRLVTPELQENLLSYEPRLEIVYGATGLPSAYSHAGRQTPADEPGRFWILMFKVPKQDAEYDALIRTALMFSEELDRVAYVTPPPSRNQNMEGTL
jgi:hypothetical protein